MGVDLKKMNWQANGGINTVLDFVVYFELFMPRFCNAFLPKYCVLNAKKYNHLF
jgi:hypothetical protein